MIGKTGPKVRCGVEGLTVVVIRVGRRASKNVGTARDRGKRRGV